MSIKIKQDCRRQWLPSTGKISNDVQGYYNTCVKDGIKNANEKLRRRKLTTFELNQRLKNEKDEYVSNVSDNINAIPSSIGNALWSPVSGVYTVGKAVGQTIGEGTSNAINATGTGIYNLSGNKTKKQIQEELIEMSNARERYCLQTVNGYGQIVDEGCEYTPIIKEDCKQLQDCQTRACQELNDECPIQIDNELKQMAAMREYNCLENNVADEDCPYTPIIEKNCKKLQDCQTPACMELNDECPIQSEGGKKTRKHKKSKKTMKKSKKHRKKSRKHRKTKSV
jgi:hypothetical protein